MPRTTHDQIILDLLKTIPGRLYITQDGTKLYALANEDTVLEFTGPDFSTMTDEDVNDYIVDIFKQFAK